MPGGWEWLIIIVVLVLLFGAKRLPDMARSVGQSARVFKGEMKGMRDDEGAAPPQQRTPAAELPPADDRSYADPRQDRRGNEAGTGTPPATEPLRRDLDR